jgi:hypothetical protein
MDNVKKRFFLGFILLNETVPLFSIMPHLTRGLDELKRALSCHCPASTSDVSATNSDTQT